MDFLESCLLLPLDGVLKKLIFWKKLLTTTARWRFLKLSNHYRGDRITLPVITSLSRRPIRYRGDRTTIAETDPLSRWALHWREHRQTVDDKKSRRYLLTPTPELSRRRRDKKNTRFSHGHPYRRHRSTLAETDPLTRTSLAAWEPRPHKRD